LATRVFRVRNRCVTTLGDVASKLVYGLNFAQMMPWHWLRSRMRNATGRADWTD